LQKNLQRIFPIFALSKMIMTDKQISKLENLVLEYKRVMQEQVNLEKLTYYAITYHSTAIEGSTLTEGQVYKTRQVKKSRLQSSLYRKSAVWC
jgi:hypothetical protein